LSATPASACDFASTSGNASIQAGRPDFAQGGVAPSSCTSSTYRSSRLALRKIGHGRIDVLGVNRP
jgi:hypothetical protein